MFVSSVRCFSAPTALIKLFKTIESASDLHLVVKKKKLMDFKGNETLWIQPLQESAALLSSFGATHFVWEPEVMKAKATR